MAPPPCRRRGGSIRIERTRPGASPAPFLSSFPPPVSRSLTLHLLISLSFPRPLNTRSAPALSVYIVHTLPNMPADILTSHFRSVFEDVLTPARQQQAIDSLQDFIYEAQYGTDEQRRDIGVLDDEDADEHVVERKLTAALEKCYWQMVMFLRVRSFTFASGPLP